MFGRWSTINDQGELEFLEIKEPNYNYDRMNEIESHTDYYFSPGTKAEVLADEVAQEANYTWLNVESVFSNAAQGVKNASTVFKYLPFIALAAGGYMLLNKKAA